MNAAFNSQASLPWSGPAAPIRRLGGSVSLARRLYFLDFPLLLLSVGLFTWIVPTDTMLFISALTGGAAGLYTLWDIAIRRGPIRFSHFFCIANTVGYGLGVVNSWLTISRGNMSLAAFFDRDPQAVAQAMAAVLISSAILYSLGEIYESPVFGEDFKLRIDNRAPAFVFMGTVVILIGVATGRLGYMGVSAGANGQLGFFAGLLGWLRPTLFAFTCIVLLEWRKGLLKWILGATLALQFLLVVPTGRRNILYFVLLAVIATRFSSFTPRWSIVRKAVYAGILAALVGIGSVAFYYLRVVSWGKHEISLPDRISLAWTFYESGNTAKANSDFAQNLQKRTFVLGYVSDLLDASFRMAPAKGADAWHEFELAIPSVFWANKSEFLYAEESIADMQFHFAYTDEANSIYSAGALDFGIWGMILYPIIVAALFRLVAEMVRSSLPEMVSTIVILAMLFDALMTEAGLWVRLVTMRDSLLFAAVLWLFFKMPAFSMSHPPSRGVLQ
jgi:hypothetical protein